jgi:hypothetical protein
LRAVSLGIIAGVVYAVSVNLSPTQIDGAIAGHPVLSAIVFGNVLVWAIVGLVLSWRIHIARTLGKTSEQVEVDIFDLSAMKPLARNGLVDVLVVCSGLALTAIQALDATFRADNYVNSLLVAVPAAVILFFMPLYAVHLRVVASRGAQLEQLAALIRQAPRDLSVVSLNQMEVLLQRKERLQSLSTWPIDLSMISRLLFYGVIPPLAWAGAALVENLVDTMLTTAG